MTVRAATPADAPAMADILNQIIALGGTTAHEDPKSVETILADYVTGPDVLASVVALDAGRVIGWQSVELWQGDAHIGTFVTPGVQARGAGAAMFALTRAMLSGSGVTAIIASIRADNVPGLAYYARLGFADFARDPDFALRDGRVVGRVHRRYDLV
jgi:L-amino acid N-acyltransferase YncA